MQKLIPAVLAAILAFAPAAQAKDEPGVFDYWVLALTWSPQYCYNHERDQQCQRSYSFVVHGLWPQFEKGGGPEDCMDVERVERPLVLRMANIMPSSTLVQHELQEHGSCSGMNAEDYLLPTERAHRSLTMPAAYYDVPEELKTTVEEIENNFIQYNSDLNPKQIALKCSGRYLSEIRFCFDKDFNTRDCAEDVQDKCGKKVILRPTR